MKNKKEIRTIIKYLLKYKRALIINMLLSILLLLVYMITPLIEQRIIDDGLLSKNFRYLLALVILSATLNIIGFTIEYAQLHIQAGVAASFRNSLKIQSLSHALRLKMNILKKHSLLALLSDANNDINNMSSVCSNDVFGILIEFIKVFGYLFGLLILNWKLTIVVLCVIPIKILISNKTGKSSEKKMEEVLEIQKKISRWQSNNYAGINEIKNWNVYEPIEKEFAQLSNERERADRKLNMLTALDSCLKKSSEKIIFIAIYVVAAILIWQGELTIGTFIAFIQYSGYLFAPIDVISGLKIVLGGVIPSVKSFTEFINMPEEQLEEGMKLSSCPNQIIFHDITFRYDEHDVLKHFNLVLNKNEKTAILGLNGSGKSTLINLLLRYYTPNEGQILFDDNDIAKYSLANYRDAFSVMGQSVFLFNTSIKNNISMFQKPKNVLGDYGEILSYVNGLPDKENTNVGFDGAKLSGGEKQRVALARCLSKDADILILDEATSNCDVSMEELFKNILSKNQHAYVIAITHNYSLLESFDRIVILKNGQVAFDGSFEAAKPHLYGLQEKESLNSRNAFGMHKRLRRNGVKNGNII